MAAIGSVITEVIHPFGRGLTNTTGIAFGTAASTGVSTSATVDTANIILPANAILREVECGLTGYFYNTITTGNIRFSWLIKDAGRVRMTSCVPAPRSPAQEPLRRPSPVRPRRPLTRTSGR